MILHGDAIIKLAGGEWFHVFSKKSGPWISGHYMIDIYIYIYRWMVPKGTMDIPSGVIKHGLLENTIFIVDFPIETPISSGFPIAIFDYRKVYRPSATAWIGLTNEI